MEFLIEAAVQECVQEACTASASDAPEDVADYVDSVLRFVSECLNIVL